jgi:DNA-directed RNA polymerase subunit RPC12/RpoP
MQCVQCKRDFSDEDRIASISGSFMGDEHIETYYLCSECGRYTVESYRDSFTLGESEHPMGALSKEEGDERVALIRQCPRPWSKRCRCDAHRQYFDDRLD